MAVFRCLDNRDGIRFNVGPVGAALDSVQTWCFCICATSPSLFPCHLCLVLIHAAGTCSKSIVFWSGFLVKSMKVMEKRTDLSTIKPLCVCGLDQSVKCIIIRRSSYQWSRDAGSAYSDSESILKKSKKGKLPEIRSGIRAFRSLISLMVCLLHLGKWAKRGAGFAVDGSIAFTVSQWMDVRAHLFFSTRLSFVHRTPAQHDSYTRWCMCTRTSGMHVHR